MKKMIAMLLLLCFSLTLFGCKPSDENGNDFLISKTAKYDHCYEIGKVSLDNTRGGAPLVKGQEERPVYENIIMELMDLTPDKLTESYKADLTKRLDLYHYDYHWNDDNSLTIISEGEEMTFGKVTDWPTSPEWVRLFPVPARVAVKEVETGEDFVRLTVSMSLEEVKAYVEQLKAAGFTIDPLETTMVGYTYMASDPEYNSASVTYSSLIQLIEFRHSIEEDETDPYQEISHELPKTGIIETLPAITFGKVETVIDSGDSLTVTLSGVSAAEGAAFVRQCKAKFNSYVISDTESEGMTMYIGLNAKDVSCTVIFYGDSMSISVAK